MKFSATLVALALAATATAQKIAISNPTKGSKWEVGKPQQLIWSGNCAGMGANAGNVSIQIVNGPSGAVQFKGDIGKLDCSGSVTTTAVTIGTDVESGDGASKVVAGSMALAGVVAAMLL
ncbi:hypothetical protein BGZ93_001526 [Podila epicladia]|nr:hypothetical protein BGZ93_001526 [Podila epicladia]